MKGTFETLNVSKVPFTAVASPGYSTPSAFVAAFRREVGVPPARYFAG